MLEVFAMILAVILCSFFAFFFWELAENTDRTILTALFGSLTVVFSLLSVVSVIAFFGVLLSIGGVGNG